MPGLDFEKFKRPIKRQFDHLSKHDMFKVDVDKDLLWETYLNSFPPGTNECFRKQREYDCNCCRQFIRAVGDAVAIIDNKVVSIWDIYSDEPAFMAVAIEMAKLVKSSKIKDVFLHYDSAVGTDFNYENKEDFPRKWIHFHVDLPTRSNYGREFLCKKKDIATTLGVRRADHDVFLRGLTELTQESIDTVLEIIGQNSLYRGNEYREMVKEFGLLKKKFDKLKSEDAKDIFAWSHLSSTKIPVLRIRNTAIGTLLIDLSNGLDLEDAVRKFETSIMAPSNYKRPTALVSQKMVDKAKEKVEELGLTSALERRYATIEDININNIIFVNNSVKDKLKGSVFDGIATKRSSPQNLSKVEVLPIDKFIQNVVPNVESIEVFFENEDINNLVSLIAPKHKSSKTLFKWNNNFSWTYNGDVTDSIKERVKKAGGNVTGDLCCRLAWYNYDDLDFHMKEPGGFEIYFPYNNRKSPYTKGELDVDMNAGVGNTREPVENIFYVDRHKMKNGRYELFVHQFCKRENTNVGFEVEIDYLGEVKHFAYDKSLKSGEKITVAEFEYNHNNGVRFITTLPATAAVKTVWGLQTQGFHKVNVLMTSPNHWDGEKGIGNKHYFFMLDGCINEGESRGFFNEFLRGDLEPHKKVLELVGGKMKVESSENQLSGLGFSDTKRKELLVKVSGNVNRTLKVLI